MTELELRALLGDRKAQEECTRHGILLPCPFCGGRAEKDYILGKIYFGSDNKPSNGYYTYCTGINCPTFGSYSRYYRTEIESVLAWNTRPAPPIGRCWECVYSTGPDENSMLFCENLSVGMKRDDFCSDFKPKERKQ